MIKDLKNILTKIIESHNRNSPKYLMTLKKERDEDFTIYYSKFKHILSISVGCRVDESNNKIISVSTLIGAGNGGSDYNRSVFERLKINLEAENAIQSFYRGCNFVSGIRLNTFKTNVWFNAEIFDSINDYLRQFDKIPVTRHRLPKQKCIDELNLRRAVGQFSKLQQYAYRSYHWLEFLAISEYFDGTKLAEGKFKSIEKTLTRAIEKHIQGMKLIFKVRQIRNRKKERC